MYQRRNPERPTVPDRHQQFLNLNGLNELIGILETAYRETGNEKVLVVAQRLIHIKDQALAKFREAEAYWREDEIKEALGSIDALPHSVRTWLLYYRDKELE